MGFFLVMWVAIKSKWFLKCFNFKIFQIMSSADENAENTNSIFFWRNWGRKCDRVRKELYECVIVTDCCQKVCNRNISYSNCILFWSSITLPLLPLLLHKHQSKIKLLLKRKNRLFPLISLFLAEIRYKS